MYGQFPFRVAVIHGGPGAPGGMSPVARQLAARRGVLEPLQTARSLEGQVQELKDVLQAHGDPPLTLVGFSWGAWLGFIVAAQYPELVSKLILVGSGGFEAQDAIKIQAVRQSRFSAAQKAELETLQHVLADPDAPDRSAAFARFGAIYAKVDAYDPLPHEPKALAFQPDVFAGVWPEAAKLRQSGALLALGKQIKCPVLAIHGAYDSHPAEGVQKPLAATLKRFRFVLFKNCGHEPWYERQARDAFYRILEQELDSQGDEPTISFD